MAASPVASDKSSAQATTADNGEAQKRGGTSLRKSLAAKAAKVAADSGSQVAADCERQAQLTPAAKNHLIGAAAQGIKAASSMLARVDGEGGGEERAAETTAPAETRAEPVAAETS